MRLDFLAEEQSAQQAASNDEKPYRPASLAVIVTIELTSGETREVTVELLHTIQRQQGDAA